MPTDLCSQAGGNTGGPGCEGKRRRPLKFLAGGAVFTPSQYASRAVFQSNLIAATRLPSGSSGKLYAFPEIFDVVDNTEADTFGNLANGPKRRLKKGKPGYTYSVEIGQTQFQRLLPFDGKVMPIWTLDEESKMWQYRNATNLNISGEMAYISISGQGFEDGKSAESGVCTISISYLSKDDFDKRSAYMTLPDLAAGDLVGLKDVVMSEPVAHTVNAYKIKFKITNAELGGDLDVYDEFGAGLAALTFTAFTGATFATALPITSKAVDATNKAITFTFDNTAHGALPDNAQIELVAPNTTALYAADITGIEIAPIILTKTP